jgi:flavorubredoxin
LNNIVYPSIAEYLTHLRGLRPKARVAGGFGSFGWSGGAVKEMYAEFERMGLESFGPGVEIKYKPSDEDKQRCYEFGRGFAKKVKEYDEGLG